MKNTVVLFFLFFTLSFNTIYSQSFIKIRVNAFNLYDTYTSDFKIGLGIGHEKITLNRSWFKLIIGQNLDFKHTNISYYKGGLGAGSTTMGNINFLNAQLDVKTRFGKQFFVETGVYSSLSLLKKITKGQVIASGCVYNPPNSTICQNGLISPITNQASDFNAFDGGVLLGLGYTYQNLTFIIDGQLGLFKILESKYNNLKSEQINLSLILPLKKSKI